MYYSCKQTTLLKCVPLVVLVLFVAVVVHQTQHITAQTGQNTRIKIYLADKNETVQSAKVVKSSAEWKRQLGDLAFEVTRNHGTERAFTGAFYKSKEKGIYKCVCCSTDLFRSDHKFDSGTGWPSFWQPVSTLNVTVRQDNSYGMVREEVLCTRCDAHLGHVFNDGPKPTGLRYCINSVALIFEKR